MSSKLTVIYSPTEKNVMAAAGQNNRRGHRPSRFIGSACEVLSSPTMFLPATLLISTLTTMGQLIPCGAYRCAP